jgi:high-affinity nickel permease
MEMTVFAAGFLLMGFRHGLDSDHVAAIADMVGAQTARGPGRNLRLGLMYALGHGMVVLVAGLLAVYLGARLPESALKVLEMLVGATLVALGAGVIASMVRNRHSGRYVSRAALVGGWLRGLTGRRSEPKLQGLGAAGAFVVGVIHGIGAETPTQLALISTVAGIGSMTMAGAQILLFTAGLLAATTFVAFAASVGFVKAALNRRLCLALGCLTGAYSMGLGAAILLR